VARSAGPDRLALEMAAARREQARTSTWPAAAQRLALGCAVLHEPPILFSTSRPPVSTGLARNFWT